MLTLLLALSPALATDRHAANAVAVSADGSTVWSGDDKDKVVRRWDAASGALQATLPFPDAIGIGRVDVGANGDLLVGDASKAWLVTPDGAVKAIDGAAALDRTGTRLVVVQRSGDVTVYSLPDMTEVKKVKLAQSFAWDVGLDLSPDGRFLAVGTSDYKKPTNLEVWDLEQGVAVGTIPKVKADGDVVLDVEVAPNGQRVAFSADKGSKTQPPVVYDAKTGKAVGKIGVASQTNDMAWTDDGQQLVLATQSGILRSSADPATPGSTSYVDGVTYQGGPTYSNQYWLSVAVTPDGKTIVGGAYGDYDGGTWGVVRDEKLYFVDFKAQ